MAQLVIDNLEDDLRDKLQGLARDHGHSVEDEVRDILRGAVEALPGGDSDADMGSRLARRFAGLGLDQDIPELRFGPVQPPSFDP